MYEGSHSATTPNWAQKRQRTHHTSNELNLNVSLLKPTENTELKQTNFNKCENKNRPKIYMTIVIDVNNDCTYGRHTKWHAHGKYTRYDGTTAGAWVFWYDVVVVAAALARSLSLSLCWGPVCVSGTSATTTTIKKYQPNWRSLNVEKMSEREGEKERDNAYEIIKRNKPFKYQLIPRPMHPSAHIHQINRNEWLGRGPYIKRARATTTTPSPSDTLVYFILYMNLWACIAYSFH